jgi:DGQHR domain-containing protein
VWPWRTKLAKNTLNSKKKITKMAKKKKAPPTPQQLRQQKQMKDARAFFERLGFERFKIDGQTFTFSGRTGELDDCFLSENIVVLCEYTTTKVGTEHFAKKKLLFDLINAKQKDWIEFLREIHQPFDAVMEKSPFASDQMRVKIVYLSDLGVSDEISALCTDVKFLDGTTFRYFDLLSKTIYRSARHEFFKYLELNFSEIGSQVNVTSTDTKSFSGYLLPETHSSFPKGFKVVSFYADPSTLLSMSYVLRRDSWRDGEGFYQRILIPSKIRKMRKYLTDQSRVFVNNIVVTLPASTILNEPSHGSKNVPDNETDKVRHIKVALPHESNTIGVVDGQHRIFCYHEGKDIYEGSIAKMRGRQNLLVTGIIFPPKYDAVEQLRFEAKLFLEINDTQSGAKADLKQGIELILNPLSTTAIAKAVINDLAKRGPLKDMLQTSFFDSAEKIKTTSIVSYGLKPLVKLSGVDSVFHQWTNAKKAELVAPPSGSNVDTLLTEYVAFCVLTINNLLLAVMHEYGTDKWKLAPGTKNHVLSPTVLNGLFVCLRELIKSDRVSSTAAYQLKLKGLEKFDFSTHKSSQWRKLGEAIFSKYFS